ncbi:MAG: 30S ribosomal protein S6--L-glutamate ligase [Spirochaetia bacterium]
MVNKIVVGTEEWCSLPEMGIPAIKARIDSGAKTSSIHAVNIQAFERNGAEWVSFEVHPLQNNRKTVIRHEAKVIDVREVKNTSGIPEKRYVIRELMKLGEDSWEIELTLANRDAMGFRMLLGREAMIEKVLIDPSGKMNLTGYNPTQIHHMYERYQENENGLQIGLLASDPDLYSNKRLIEAGEERGHKVTFFNIRQCYMKLDPKKPEVHYRGGNVLSELDAVIPRIRPSMTFYGCAVVRQFESMGVATLNRASAITQSRDKLYASQMFVKEGLPMPLTGFAHSPQDTNDLIDVVGGAPLIIKLLEGTQGKGVVLAETKKASQSVINAFKSLNANLLVQDFIKEAGGSDIRCFVIGGKVIAAIMRQAAPGEYRANIHQGGKAKYIKITAEERKLAVKATKVLGLDVAGVDIIRSDDGPMLLEVNSSPGLEGIENATGKDIAGMMIIELEKRLNWKRVLAAEEETYNSVVESAD